MTAVEAASAGDARGAAEVDLPRVLDALGFDPDEHVSVSSRQPGGPFVSEVVPVVLAGVTAERVRDGRDVYFSVNAVREGTIGRGKAADVSRWAALWADLDVKPGGLPDMAAAEAVVNELSGLVRQRPVALIRTGHGLQPLWALDPEDPAAWLDDAARTEAETMLRRWGRLVAHVAERHGGGADPVFDLARVLRCPATVNVKAEPVPVVTELPGGSPLSVGEIGTVLDGFVPELPVDRRAVGGEVLSDPSGWGWASASHPWALKMINGWKGDTPAKRHNWLVDQAVRLHAAWRRRYLTEADFREGVRVLDRRYVELQATTGERPQPGESAAALSWGCNHVAAMTDVQVQKQTGGVGDQHDRLLAPTLSGAATATTATTAATTATILAPASGPASVTGRFDFRDGGSFVFDLPDSIPAIWGEGTEVLWASGEALMIVGNPGVGKSTLGGQLVRGRLGLLDELLGYPVAEGRRRTLYLAMDRPQQIARSLRRMFTPDERDVVSERLVVWPRPPESDMAQAPGLLLEMAQAANADTIVVDSLKDAAIGLTDDSVAAGYQRARSAAIAAGVEVLELHHQKKAGTNGGRPDTLADVYGSVWLTGGAGSVVLLDGVAGDPIVRLKHLKTPAAEVGPLRVRHDHEAGVSSVWHGVDLVAIARGSGVRGITPKEAARAMFETADPKPSETERARRKLDSLVTQGLLRKDEGGRGGAGGSRGTTYLSAGPDSIQLAIGQTP